LCFFIATNTLLNEMGITIYDELQVL